ncbi:hypothetical protein AB1Y20_005180 [Prymnesium parvum]|uniref:Tubulin--tyrosine ligase-like protein 9 n=1 Tax=Prymnesium parvum TaxID=97485 RepID=A0AB34J5J1_PRYPA
MRPQLLLCCALLCLLLQVCALLLRTANGHIHHDSAYLPVIAREADAGPSSSPCARLLCSLQQAITLRLVAEPLWCYDGYRQLRSSWDARYLIDRVLMQAGYHQPSHLAGTDYSDHVRVAGLPPLVIMPNYWSPGAEDWRTIRLQPFQKINRVWGMEGISRKDRLVQTLNSSGVAGGVLMPTSFLWRQLRRTSDWQVMLAAQPTWVLKSTSHRGVGVRVVTIRELRLAELGEGAPEIRSILKRPDAVLQQVISNPLLVNGRKLSLRLYSLITSTDPLCVYLYNDGFALFSFDKYDAVGMAHYGFVTNAFVSRQRAEQMKLPSHESTLRDSELSDEARAARGLGIDLPPHTLRWSFRQLMRFLGLRQNEAVVARITIAIRRLVLQTWLSARSQLLRSARESLASLGLQGPHEYGHTFELAGFDLIIDDALKPWLIEINTTPSLKLDTSAQDLGIKQQMVTDLFKLVDVLPDAHPPPESALCALLEANDNFPQGDCYRHWKLSGCSACPTVSEVAHLARIAAEHRRRGGFEPLSPSFDSELQALTRASHPDLKLQKHLGRKQRPLLDELALDWLSAPLNKAHTCDSHACVSAKWSSMLCPM